MTDKELIKFSQDIGFPFQDESLLRQAFVHRSYLNEHRHEKLEHNERLEFLGDAVLELVVTDYLFHHYPQKPEGELTAFRAALVNTITLSGVASEVGFNEYLLLSKGEAKDTGRARQYILANTFESFVGSLYLDQGYSVASRFIEQSLLSKADKIVRDYKMQDPKSYFQEKAQEYTGTTPTYKLLSEVGPDHDKRFTVGLFIGDEMVASGEGHSKQEAEVSAAKAGLELKGWMEK